MHLDKVLSKPLTDFFLNSVVDLNYFIKYMGWVKGKKELYFGSWLKPLVLDGPISGLRQHGLLYWVCIVEEVLASPVENKTTATIKSQVWSKF